jgi:hypothetical protein
MNKMARLITHLFLVFLVVLFVTPLPQTSKAQSKSMGKPAKQVYTGNIIYFNGNPGPSISNPDTLARNRGSRNLFGGTFGSTLNFFTLTVNSFTPDSEVSNIMEALKNGGQEGVIKALGKEKRGTIQIGSQLGRDVQAIWVTQTDEGRKICALSERWMGFGEMRRGARSTDYPFTYIELYPDDNGKGEGSLIPAARVQSKGGNNIEVENFGIYPARLTNVKVSSK